MRPPFQADAQGYKLHLDAFMLACQLARQHILHHNAQFLRSEGLATAMQVMVRSPVALATSGITVGSSRYPIAECVVLGWEDVK